MLTTFATFREMKPPKIISMIPDILDRCKHLPIESVTTHRNGCEVPNGSAFALFVRPKMLSKRLTKFPYHVSVAIIG